MIKVENDTTEIKGSIEDVTYDLAILLKTLMRGNKYADAIIKCAIKSAKKMIAQDVSGTDLSDDVNATLKRPR